MLNTVNNSEYLTISDIAHLFRIEKSIRTNVMRLLLKLEETKEIDLKLNFCDFYAVVSREKLQEALALRELPQIFMTVKEATQELKITERRVRLLISNGRLKNYCGKSEKRNIASSSSSFQSREVYSINLTFSTRFPKVSFTKEKCEKQ